MNIIRWILFIPSVYIVLILFVLIYDFLFLSILGENLSIITSKFFSSLIAVPVTYFFAPNYKKNVVLLFIPLLCFESILLYLNVVHNSFIYEPAVIDMPIPTAIDLVGSIFSLIGYICTSIYFLKIKKLTNN